MTKFFIDMEKQDKFLKPEIFADFDSDGFIQVKELRKGDIVYECERGCNFELKVVEDPIYNGKGWTCIVADSSGEIEDIYVSKKYGKFARIYKCPQYLEKVDERYVYIIS